MSVLDCVYRTSQVGSLPLVIVVSARHQRVKGEGFLTAVFGFVAAAASRTLSAACVSGSFSSGRGEGRLAALLMRM